MSDYSKEQEKAVEAFGSNVVVSAGAGSGKTRVLSYRVLHILEEHPEINIKDFLILTFTELAAGEMKKRIKDLLLKRKPDAADYVDFADIRTFDSFALSIAKKYHYELNLAPNISIVDGSIIDVKKRQIIEKLFEEEYEKEDPDFMNIIESYCFKDDNNVRQLLLDLYNKALNENDTEEYLNSYVDRFYSDEYISSIISIFVNEFKEFKKKALDLLELLPDDVMVNSGSSAYATVKDYLYELSNANTYNEFIHSLDKELPFFKTSNKWSSEASAAKKDLYELIKKYKEKMLTVLPQSEEEFYKLFHNYIPQVRKLVQLALKLHAEIQSFKLEKNVFEFADIAKLVLHLVQNNKQVREELQKTYKVIMIDEYQDTSLLQDELVTLISNNNVFMVGDVKQSIYRFRKARCDLFMNKYNAYKAGNGGEAIDMNTNYRTREEILDDINLLFSNIMNNEHGNADYKNDHQILSGNNSYKKNKNNDNKHIEFYYYDKSKSNDDAETEARIIARDIITKLNSGYQILKEDKEDAHFAPCEPNDFCILIDRVKEFDIYTRVFKEYGIPLYVEYNENIANNYIILILTNILKLINCIKSNDYESNDFVKSFLSIARSFLYSYSDEKLYEISKQENGYKEDIITTSLENFIKENQRLSSYEFVEALFNKLDIYHKLCLIGDVKKNEVYINYFLSSFKNMSQIGFGIVEFIDYMNYVSDYNLEIKIPSVSTSLNAVKLMNIHKSKGLEFNIIYFARFNKQFMKEQYKSPFGVSNFGLILERENPNDLNIIRYINNKYEIKEELSEKIRLLYVALTRVKDKAIIIDNYSSGKANIDLETAINNTPKTLDYEKVDCLMDLLRPYVCYPVFNKTLIDLTTPIQLNSKIEHIEQKPFEFEEVKINKEEIEQLKASKNISLETNKELLDFGSRLHLIMEVTDFKNPNYDILGKDAKYVEKFLTSDLCKNIKEASIYKELEFLDSINNTKGVIDLLLEFNDHIDIIDYKTKHIDDDAYKVQLGIYKDYIKTIYPDKEINTYLYSLIDGTNVEIK